MIKPGILIAAAAMTLAACAPDPDKVKPTYTPSVLYENLSCKQLVAEGREVSKRAHKVADKERRHRNQDKVAVGASIILWPAVLFKHGADATAAELAQLKGQMKAIEKASEAKDCDIVFERV